MFVYILVLLLTISIIAGSYILLPHPRKRQLRILLRDKYHTLCSRYLRLKRKHIDVIPEAQRIGDCLLIPYSCNSGVYQICIPVETSIKREMIGVKVYGVSNLTKQEIDITQQNGIRYTMTPRSLDCESIKFVKNDEVVILLTGDETYATKKMMGLNQVSEDSTLL